MRTPTHRQRLDETRAAHYLRRSPAVGRPRLCVAVEAIYRAVPGERLSSEMGSELIAWEGCAWGETFAPGSYLDEARGLHQWDWFAWLAHHLRRGYCTWIWCVNVGHTAALLGLWERITTGLWRLEGSDPCDNASPAQEPNTRQRGLCVLSSSCSVVLCRPSHAPGLARWVDLRNYGVGDTGELPGAGSGSLKIRQWVQEYTDLVSSLNLGGVRHGVGAQAWHGWRHGYLESPILVHGNDKAIRLERASLYSGRCEVFKLGRTTGPVCELDASSHYAACAVSETLPCRLGGAYEGDADLLFDLEQYGWLCIANVDVETSEPLVPVDVGGLTIYPTGEWNATYCGPELRLLFSHGAVKRVREIAYYEPGRPFDGYVRALWDELKSGRCPRGSSRRRLVKLLLVSLFGKCAQWGWSWLDRPASVDYRPWRQWYGIDPDEEESRVAYALDKLDNGESLSPADLPVTRWRSVGWHTQFERCTGETQDSCPALAAWIYSRARVRLWQWMQAAGRENVYYCDTDSVYVNNAGFVNLCGDGHVDDDALGKLRMKDWHDWLDVYGLKLYSVPGRTVAAGVRPPGAVDSDAGYTWYVPESVSESIRRNREPRGALRTGAIPTLRPYRHGIVRPDGSVIPHAIGR